ncbi:Hypothetical predicted protein [Cloeon dipterum]|uniref:Uncharacterized protein n=1 Tax=Cloeon dipterum TaxID=197152 RepID=A0A8S1CSA0_9INSE|nr:Hypothetical predicted protein [Cloeon dipterum]
MKTSNLQTATQNLEACRGSRAKNIFIFLQTTRINVIRIEPTDDKKVVWSCQCAVPLLDNQLDTAVSGLI